MYEPDFEAVKPVRRHFSTGRQEKAKLKFLARVTDQPDMVALLVLAVCGLAISIALDTLLGRVQTKRAQTLLAKGEALFDEGDLEGAERIWNKAAACSAWARGGPIYFLAHYNLANVRFRMDRYAQAEKAARRAFQSIGSLRERVEWGAHASYPEVRNCLTVLAESLTKQERYPEAIPYYEALVGLWREADGEQSYHAGYYSQELGAACCRLGLYGQALDHLTWAAETLRHCCGPHHPAVATALLHCGEAQIHTGRLLEAEQSLQQALEIRREMLGGRHMGVAAVLAKLGELHVERAEYETAASYYEEAIAIYLPQLGEEDPVVAALRNQLADSLRRQGQWKESEKLARLAMSVLTEANGPSLSCALETMAELKNEQGSLEEAADFYRQSRECLERSPSGDLSRKARLLHSEARVLRQLGDDGVADELASLALAIREAIKNTPSPEPLNRASLLQD